MDKGFGIAALVVALIAIVIPLVGWIFTGLAIILAIVAALSGDRIFSSAASIIALVNTFMLSPTTWVVLQDRDTPASFGWIVAALILAPFVAMWVNASGHFSFNSASASRSKN